VWKNQVNGIVSSRLSSFLVTDDEWAPGSTKVMRHSTDLSHLAVKIPFWRDSSYDQCCRPEEMWIDSGRAFETYTILHILINLTRAGRVIFMRLGRREERAPRVNCCARRTLEMCRVGMWKPQSTAETPLGRRTSRHFKRIIHLS
jgi:hypothetical protein